MTSTEFRPGKGHIVEYTINKRVECGGSVGMILDVKVQDSVERESWKNRIAIKIVGILQN